jgi:hypothetical protein
MPDVVHQVLRTLEPSLFDNEATKQIDGMTLVFYVCRLLDCKANTILPCFTHEVEPTVQALLAALSQHYQATGGLPAPKTLENLNAGYYCKDETGKSIVCTIDTKEQKTKIVLDHVNEIDIENCLDVDTDVRVVTNGIAMQLGSIKSVFEGEGVNLPTLGVEWKGELFGAKKPEPPARTPPKRKGAPADTSPASGSADPSAFASTGTVLLSEALRRKVQKGTGGSSSGPK